MAAIEPPERALLRSRLARRQPSSDIAHAPARRHENNFKTAIFVTSRPSTERHS
jgi:hypothetical protein